MLGTHARRPTVGFLGWFGPRGLASIVFAALIVEQADLPHTDTLLVTIFATIGLSVFAHGLSARPLTDRYAAWYEAHPRVPMERVEVHADPWRGVRRARRRPTASRAATGHRIGRVEPPTTTAFRATGSTGAEETS